jgi:hypothetical protein
VSNYSGKTAAVGFIAVGNIADIFDIVIFRDALHD